MKYQFTNKLIIYNLFLGRDVIHKLGIIYNFENTTITWQEVSTSIKLTTYTKKEFFVIKENMPVRIANKRIKHFLDAENKNIILKTIAMK